MKSKLQRKRLKLFKREKLRIEHDFLRRSNNFEEEKCAEKKKPNLKKSFCLRRSRLFKKTRPKLPLPRIS